MKKIELEGNVGDELELSYNGGSLIVKLDVHGIAPDFTDAVFKAMKKNTNAFLSAAHRINSSSVSGESNARKEIEKVVKESFDAVITPPFKKPVDPKPEKKEPEPEKTVEKTEEKKAPASEKTTDGKVAEPEPEKKNDDVPTAPEEKNAEDPDVKTSKTTAKKTTNKKKSS